MTSLIFRALDEHVIGGLADHPAIKDERGTMSYAQLLHESASLAGALRHLRIDVGSDLAIELPDGREQVIAVLACARLGAVPRGTAAYRLTGTPPVLHTPDTEVAWDVLIRAGRMEPAEAPDKDPDGYETLMRDEYEDVFATLAAGEVLT
jgi:hypothetical protein